MANLPKDHSTLSLLDELFKTLRVTLVSGTPKEQVGAEEAFQRGLRYCQDAAACIVQNVAATQAPSDLSLFAEAEVAPEPVAAPDTTAKAIAR